MANVKFDNITFRYGMNTVLENFSLEVESGTIVCLVGPSGCGKTTLVRALLGLNKPETGSITVGDRVLFDAKKRVDVQAMGIDEGLITDLIHTGRKGDLDQPEAAAEGVVADFSQALGKNYFCQVPAALETHHADFLNPFRYLILIRNAV